MTDWWCPSCKAEQEAPAKATGVHHVCPRLSMLSVPMVRKGVKAKVVTNEREDYVGRERVQLLGPDRRPIMNMVTTRDDGQDVAIFAPTATGQRS